MSNECINIFIIQIEYIAKRNCQTLSQPKPWCSDSVVLNLHHGYYTTIKTSRTEVVSSQPSVKWYKSTNQKIGIRTVYENFKNNNYTWPIK